MIIITNSSQYKGKVIDHFEDEDGHSLPEIDMNNCVVIVFTDGTKLKLGSDQRGIECYISQYEERK